MNIITRALIRIGLTRVLDNGKLFVPFHWPSWEFFKAHLLRGGGPVAPRFYIFRNRANVIKWIPGRWLPRRWGFGFCGIEIGDRG